MFQQLTWDSPTWMGLGLGSFWGYRDAVLSVLCLLAPASGAGLKEMGNLFHIIVGVH